MGFIELTVLAIGLAMDAFAVSICKGLAMDRAKLKSAATVGLWFGGFQAAMPVLGYLLGARFSNAIQGIDHWIAFALLALIGANMIREALAGGEEETSGSLAFKPMLAMAVATSIDALAVGVTFAFLQVNIAAAAALIGIITFALSAVGVKIGNVFGVKYKSRAEFAGGAILIILGAKILLEHLGVL